MTEVPKKKAMKASKSAQRRRRISRRVKPSVAKKATVSIPYDDAVCRGFWYREDIAALGDPVD